MRIGAAELTLRQHPQVHLIVNPLQSFGAEIGIVPCQDRSRNSAAERIFRQAKKYKLKIEMKKIIVIVLVACLAASTAWILFREKRAARGPWGEMSIEEAIAIVKAYVAKIEKIPEENILIDKIESRPPTESESDFLLEWGEEPPELMWFADAAIRMTMTGTAYCKVWLDAYTEEIVYGPFLFQIEIEGGLPDGGPVMPP
ncbi:hypothetical protein ES703_15586 [subsurface metagenome]